MTTSSKPLTILHTSDWHLGRRLYEQMRYEEFAAFLSWLENCIYQNEVDILIVAGDIFDTMTPSNRAQSLYYEFLATVARSSCQHIVIVAGNHDSPTLLDAPSNLLKSLNVHVVGTACEELQDEVLVLNDSEGTPSCIVIAVPYLRDRDVRSSQAGESDSDKDGKVVQGIKAHYDGVANIAKARQQLLTKTHQRHIPIIATGHLFASGGRTTDDDGVRNLYVGSLGKISADMFDPCFDYVALGHLHVPQRVGGREHIRYSGSPIPMGFGEASQQKQVLLIQFCKAFNNTQPTTSHLSNSLQTTTQIAQCNIDTTDILSTAIASKEKLSQEKQSKEKTATENKYVDDLFADDDLFAGMDNLSDKALIANSQQSFLDSNKASSRHEYNPEKPTPIFYDQHKQMQISSIAIPTFQKLVQIKGDMAQIKRSINTLGKDKSIWLEVIYDGNEIISNLNEQIQQLINDTKLKALKIKNTNNYNKVLTSESSIETLQDLTVMEVFERCLTLHDIAEFQKNELRDAYQQILHDTTQEDVNSGEV